MHVSLMMFSQAFMVNSLPKTNMYNPLGMSSYVHFSLKFLKVMYIYMTLVMGPLDIFFSITKPLHN